MHNHRKRPILGITYRNGLGYGYDFENHMISAGGGITMVGACPERSRRDGDGNRVSKTVAGVTTKYLVDPQNPTGYVQVVQENYSGSTGANRELSHSFVYGLERISQFRSYLANNQSQTQTSYYVYDGHGSTRALTDPNGAVTDTYDYDAFGSSTRRALRSTNSCSQASSSTPTSTSTTTAPATSTPPPAASGPWMKIKEMVTSRCPCTGICTQGPIRSETQIPVETTLAM